MNVSSVGISGVESIELRPIWKRLVNHGDWPLRVASTTARGGHCEPECADRARGDTVGIRLLDTPATYRLSLKDRASTSVSACSADRDRVQACRCAA